MGSLVRHVAASSLAPELTGPLLDAIAEAAGIARSAFVVSVSEGEPRNLYVSAMAAELIGYEPEELLGKTVWAFLAPEELPRLMALHARRLSGEGKKVPEPIETVIVRRDGRRVPIEVASTRTVIAGLPANVAFLTDLTERKAVQARLAQADRLAAVGTLAAGVAHEINNPLAYVMLGLEGLRRDLTQLPIDTERKELLLDRLKEISEGAGRVATIVRDLRTFSRTDDEHKGPADVRAALEHATRITENEIRHRATLVRDYADVPPAHGNQARLEQVFLNLLVNAYQALTSRGSASNEVRISLRSENDDLIVAEITDTGCGIPNEVIDRVFDPFFTTKAVGEGTGLGLPICRSIVTGIGGRMELDSTPGAGTRVRVILPVYRPATLPPNAPREINGKAGTGRRGRILIIDDEPGVTRTLSGFLETDHAVTTAPNARAALEVLEKEGDFDLILCDVMMPTMNGIELHQRLLEKHPEHANRVVFMTGGAFAPEVAALLAKSGIRTLDKPFDYELLTTLLRERVR